MRGWVSAVANYSTPVGIGEVMRSFAAGTVIASRHPGFAEGDKVMGMLGWQQYAVSDGANITRKVKETDLPLSLSLGVLGLNGVTAYFGLLDLGEPKPGDTVVVSTAAGAVGSAVGQIARAFGLPHGRNHRRRGQRPIVPRRVRLRRCDRLQGRRCRARRSRLPARKASTSISTIPPGRSAMPSMRSLRFTRASSICGTASVSSWDPWPHGPRLERHILVKRARISGLADFRLCAPL